jgi:putative ABC transport system permease protein
VGDLIRDIGAGARRLAKRPGFVVVVVLTLALGIGANTAIFSVVQAVLLRQLPYTEPDRLALIWGELTARDYSKFPTAPTVLREFREQASTFQSLAGAFGFQAVLTGGDGDPQQIQVTAVTPNLLGTLGITPALGRDFLEADGIVDAPQEGEDEPVLGSPATAAMLGHAFWQRRFGGDPSIVGQMIELDGNTAEVVGVLPPEFRLYLPPGTGIDENADLLTAARVNYVDWPRINVLFTVIGRLSDGFTPAQAEAEMAGLAVQLRELEPRYESAGYEIDVVPMKEDLTAPVRPVVLALLGAVVFLLLIACANVSNLLLVRATGRERELAVRAAIGASPRRLIWETLVEGGLLALGGAALGVLLAQGGIQFLLALQPENLPRLERVRIDGFVLGFTTGAAVLAALVSGTLPALHGTRVDLAASLKERGGGGLGAAGQRILKTVVIGEVALSLVLLIGAGLMVRSFIALNRTDPGFEAAGLLSFDLNMPGTRYPEPEDRLGFFRQLEDRIGAMPGVEAVSSVNTLALDDPPAAGPYGTEEALEDPAAWGQAAVVIVRPGYFEGMRTRVLEGRTFEEADEVEGTTAVVVDEVMAKRMWPDRSAVGERLLIRFGSVEPEWVDVVGVVEHQRLENLAADGRETIFYSHFYAGAPGGMTWTVRASGDPDRLIAPIRAAIGELDPLIPMADVQTMDQVVATAGTGTRFAALLIGIFAAVASLLAAVGLYGVIGYSVKRRTSELGIRMAFGARAGDVLRLVLRRGLGLAVVGVAIGLAGSVALTRVLANMLVGVTPTDPVTFATISLLFLSVAAFASYVPAWRASRLDPLVTLREE